MRNMILLLIAMTACLLLFATASAETKDIEAYPVPEGMPSQEVWFEISANGQEVGVYSDYNMEFDEVNFAYFNFRKGTEVDVEIRVLFDFRKVTVLPEGVADLETDGNILRFRAANPGDNYSFIFDDDYQYITLHLFTNPIDEDEEKIRTAFSTMYFGPGYHDLSDRQLNIGTGMTLYVAAGAVLNCPVVVENAKNVTIAGSGIIMMDKKNAVNPDYGTIVITLNHAKNVTIKGVIAHAHRSQNWTTHVYYSSDVTIENYHVVSTRYASVDALDITNSQNVTVRNCFLRSCDDCITVKGLSGKATPQEAPANEHIHVSGCTLWSDCNNAMVIGEESMAAYYDDITFDDIDVLYSYDDRDNHERLDERAVMSIVLLHGTQVSNIRWDHIRVNNCQRLICMRFVDSFWFGSIQGNQSFPGGISGVTFSNITCSSNNTSRIANQILMYGWSKDKKISGVMFDNVCINGEKLRSMMNRYMKVNEYISNITFK
ncbi:MAG: hypothetical protein CW338_08815 [Clostridiales bacterium]|nr:hypothetical protein [Clostridiales bacterium]